MKSGWSVDTRGLDELRRKLSRFDGEHSVPFGELFTPAFMGQHTRFGTFEAFVEASGFKADTPEDFKAIPDAEWDTFVAANSSFASWQEMMSAAAAMWAKGQLGL